MKNYEGMFVIKPDLKEEIRKNTVSQIGDEISKNGGVLENSQMWGKYSLSYEINKYKEGMYYLIHFKADPGVIAKLKRAYKLNENILKMLILRAS